MTDSRTVVKALTEVDPGFLALTNTLFGPSVDGNAIWEYLYGSEGVSKMSPAPSDLSTMGGAAVPRKLLARPKPQTTVSTGTSQLAAPATKNIAPKSNQTVRKPATSSVLKSDELIEVLKHAVVTGVPTEVIEDVLKGAHSAPKREAVEGAVKRVKARFAGKGKPALAGAVVAGGGVKVADDMDERRRSKVEYVMDPYTFGYQSKSENGDDDITWSGEFSKVDEDQRLAFGWASVVELNGEPVVDRQGDMIDWQELEKAAYDYVEKSRKGGNMHKRTWGPDGDEPYHVADVVESFVVTPEKIEKMGLPPTTPVGWWLGMRIHDDESWEQVKKGERAGFSIHGRGRRRAMEGV